MKHEFHKKSGLGGRKISRKEALRGLGDPKKWAGQKAALMKEFRKKPENPDIKPLRADADSLLRQVESACTEARWFLGRKEDYLAQGYLHTGMKALADGLNRICMVIERKRK